jgi:hypothetical protein
MIHFAHASSTDSTHRGRTRGKSVLEIRKENRGQWSHEERRYPSKSSSQKSKKEIAATGADLLPHVAQAGTFRTFLQISRLLDHTEIVLRVATASRVGPNMVDMVFLWVVSRTFQIPRDDSPLGRRRNIAGPLRALPSQENTKSDEERPELRLRWFNMEHLGDDDGAPTEDDDRFRSVPKEKTGTLTRETERAEPIECKDDTDAKDYPVEARISGEMNRWLRNFSFDLCRISRFGLAGDCPETIGNGEMDPVAQHADTAWKS